MSSTTKDGLIAEIKNIKRKTSLQQYCHAQLGNTFNLRSRVLGMTLTICAALALIATTAESRTLFGSIVDDQVLSQIAAFLTFGGFPTYTY